MLSIKENPYRLIVRERLLSSLRETYVGVTVPIDLSTLENDGLRAVTREKKRGRPKEKRYRSATEKGRRKKVMCGLCHALEHNLRTCKAKINESRGKQATE